MTDAERIRLFASLCDTADQLSRHANERRELGQLAAHVDSVDVFGDSEVRTDYLLGIASQLTSRIGPRSPITIEVEPLLEDPMIVMWMMEHGSRFPLTCGWIIALDAALAVVRGRTWSREQTHPR